MCSASCTRKVGGRAQGANCHTRFGWWNDPQEDSSDLLHVSKDGVLFQVLQGCDHLMILVKASLDNFGADLVAVVGDNHIGLQNVSSFEGESTLTSLMTLTIFCSQRKQCIR